MASGGGLKDLILLCLFNLPHKIGPWVVLQSLSPSHPRGRHSICRPTAACSTSIPMFMRWCFPGLFGKDVFMS